MPVDTTTIAPARDEFLKLAAKHSLIPVYRTLTADLETPVSAFLRLAQDEPQSFLLESVEGGEKVGRYTFIGIRPYRTILSRGSSITIHERGKTRSLQGDVFALFKELLAGQTPARIAGLPPFTSGAVGFFAYDVVRQLERLPQLAEDDLGIPDACLMFYDEVLAFDHVRKQIQLMVTADLGRQKPAAAYADAKKRLGQLEKRLARPIPKPKPARPRGKLSVTSHTLKEDFLASVDKIKDYIAGGDIFQAVLSQRFEVKPGVDPFSVYRALRIVNPSPYLYFLRFDLDKTSTCLVGSSPELLVRVQQRHVEYRPIAGTRPRAADEREDLRIEQELLSNEKERAEHREGKEPDARGTLLSRDAPGQLPRRSTQGRTLSGGCVLRLLPGRYPERSPQNTSNGNHRGAGANPSRHLRRQCFLRRLLRQLRLLHSHPQHAP
jgi:anthranilate synthase component 1